MGDIFGRVFSIDLDKKPFIEVTESRQFRVTFEVLIDPNGANSYADIAIYNLTNDTASDAFIKGKSITLRAGYVDSIDVIFKGEITNILRERTGTDTRTRVLCRGGVISPNRPTISKSFGAGIRLEDIIGTLGVTLGYEVILNPDDFAKIPPYPRGYTVNGDPQTYLDKLGVAHQFTYVVDNNRLVISAIGAERTGAIHVVSQFTGMEGIPEITGGEQGVGADVVIRLNPKVRINGRFRIESEYATFNTGNLYFTDIPKSAGIGVYDILRVRHSGDSYGSQWSTLITGIKNVKELEKPLEPTGDLAWGRNVDEEFRIKAKVVAASVGIQADNLMSVMAFETGESFRPDVRNPYSGAVGLIQFLRTTAVGLGTTTEALARMTAVKQLDYVQSYYRPYSGRMNNLGDTYMAVLWPAGIGKPDSYVLWSATANPTTYRQNKGLDIGNKGYITRADAIFKVNKALEKGLTRKA